MNYYEFLNFIQKSAQRKDKGKHFCFGNPGVSRNQLQSRCTIHMSLSFASGTLSCFIFQHEVPGGPEKQRTRRSFLFRPKEGTSTAGKLMGSLWGPVRTRWLPRMARRGPVAASPCTATVCRGGGSPTVALRWLKARASVCARWSTTRQR